MQVKAPRLLICAPASGGGKTTFTCGLLQAFANRGLKLQACKCGPDYIDPMFHREVIGADSRNLDLFFMSEKQTRELVAEGAKDVDVTVIEGVMGYYDGIAISDQASAWDVARVTETPAILVVDGRGRARSIAAEVLGFLKFREPSNIAGVVINRCSAMLFPRLAQLIEQECGVHAYGYVPVLDADCSLESRHLGLVTASEVADLQVKLNKIAAVLEESLDIEGLLDLAASAPELVASADDMTDCASSACDVEAAEGSAPESRPKRLMTKNPTLCHARIAVAHDDAFCFYYSDTLRMLERLGAELVYFSPLVDAHLPKGVNGLYLGGGYPELHCKELSENTTLLAEIREAIEAGMPTVAECGGFMFLHEQLEDDQGTFWPMVGAIPGRSFRTPKLGRFGYIDITAAHDNLLCAAGDTLPAHEFHYWDSDSAGDAFHAQKPQSSRSWECAHATPTLYAGYPHLCLHARPEAAARFVRACVEDDIKSGIMSSSDLLNDDENA